MASGIVSRRRLPAGPQSNDVDVDRRGLIYVLVRNPGLDILEYTGHA